MLTLAKGTEVKGRYVIHDVIATGGYGSVWKASDKELRRDVALKRLLKTDLSAKPDDITALKDEAQKNAKLIHPNIVQVYDIVEVDAEPLLVLEFIDGPSLHALLREKASSNELFPLDRSVQILRDVLLGIACAHSNGICHRDLSPLNILLTSNGVPKIADFGIARVLSDRSGRDSPSGPISQAGTGNPNYMSPEQARGEAADFASDLFMVGIVGYLLLSGRHPFAHPSGLFTIPELLRKPDFNPDGPKPPTTLVARDQQLFREYAAIVMRLLQREKAGRYTSAQEAAQAVDDVTPYLECPSCAERVPEHHKFCGLCGKPLQAPAGPNTLGTVATGPTGASTPDGLVEEGFQLTRERNWSAAISKYTEALALDPCHVKAYWNLAFALNRAGKHSEAEESATKGLSLPNEEYRPGLLYERSFARSNLKQYEEAIADIEEALALRPQSTKLLYLRSRIYQFSGDRQRAIADATEVLRRDPDHTGAYRVVHGMH